MAVVSSSCNVGGKVNDIIYVMTLADGQVERALQGHAGGVHGLAFSPDGKRLASGGRDKTIRLWDLATGTARRFVETYGSVSIVTCFSPDGSRLANDFVDSDACDLRDLTTGKVVVPLKESGSRLVRPATPWSGQTLTGDLRPGWTAPVEAGRHPALPFVPES